MAERAILQFGNTFWSSVPCCSVPVVWLTHGHFTKAVTHFSRCDPTTQTQRPSCRRE